MNLRDQEIGKKIKKYRKGKMTQQELAIKIGKTESSIRKYEKGLVTIPLDVLEAIATTLGVTAFDLMGAEYWDKKYPEIASKSKEYEGFIDYLNALGYVINSVASPCQIPVTMLDKKQLEITPEEQIKFGFVTTMSYEVELIKDGKSIILDDDEFEFLQKSTKDMIAFKLWQKSQQNK